MGRVTYSDIKAAIANQIGAPEEGWDAQTADVVERCISTGVDRVVHNGLHSWTWMRPRWVGSTAAGQRRYSLPSDFEQFVSDLYFDGVNYTNAPVTLAPSSRLMQLQAECTTTGTPSRFAIESDEHDGITDQGQILVLHPTPDAAYTLIGLYQIGVPPLSDSHPIPPGGGSHGELFMAACLAAAEAKFLDGPAAKEAAFQEMLASHIAIDLRRQPRNLGSLNRRNGRMVGRADARRVFDLQSGPTTINGVTDF